MTNGPQTSSGARQTANEASNTTSNVNSPREFEFTKPEAWPVWIKRFEKYLSVAGLTNKSEKEKVDLLCYTMGEEAEDILLRIFPNLVNETLYSEVKKKFDEYFSPKKNVIFERYKFNSRVQEESESVDSFITALHALAEKCEYEALKDDLIRDRIVIGIKDARASERLQLTPNLTLENAITLVRQAEMQEKQNKVLRSKNPEKSEVNRIIKKKPSVKKSNEKHGDTAKSENCSRCGLRKHHSKKCPALNSTCRNCGKKNHWDKVCRSKSINAIHGADPEEDDPGKDVFNAHFIGAVKRKQNNSRDYTAEFEVLNLANNGGVNEVLGLTDEEVAQMTVPELKAELRGRRLRVSEEDEDEEEEPEGIPEDAGAGQEVNLQNNDEVDRATPVIRRPNRPKQTLLLLKDVENSLEKFSGDDLMNVSRWLEDFEEMAEVCGWTEHKVAFGKKMLAGSALAFVRQERCTKTWAKLKKALEDEFQEKVTDQQIHRELGQRKKKTEETLQQYMYAMREIAGQGTVDTRSLVEYIIQGIPDEVTNKSALYGAKTMQELKERFKQYEAMKRDMKTKPKPFEKKDDKTKKPEAKGHPRRRAVGEKSDKTRCFNCGEKGAKCFNCNKFGHIAARCPDKKKESCVISRLDMKKYTKEVSIDDSKFVALVDTESDLTFIRSDEYVRLGSPPLGNRRIEFAGVGSTGNETWGDFSKVINTDGHNLPVTLHVVSNKVLTNHGLLLGTDFLDQVEVRVKRGEVTFFKLDEAETNVNAPEIFSINVIEKTKEVDLSYVEDIPYRDALRDIINGYKPEKTRDVGLTAKIVLKSEKPIVRRPRRLAPCEKKEVDDLMKMWVEDGVIRPSNSEYASPIVVVRKKDGSIRVCIDFRELNELIECPHFPLPLIDDILDALQGSEYFTTLDLKNGFFHVWLDGKSRKYTGFVTPTGQYEFLKLPFGLKISPIVFQKYITMIFKELIDKGIVIVYMDDIVILAKNLQEAWERLVMVIKLAEEYGLVINWEKCRFMLKEIEYLGYVISKDTIKPSTHKTQAVANFPKPTSVKKVQSFLGLTGYFRKFIRGYAKIAEPLTDLLRKDVKFRFGDHETEAYEALKAVLTNNPVLKLYRIGAKTELHTDASIEEYGAILMQLDPDDGRFHPVYFASGKTTPAESKYTSYELEVLAIVKALVKFRVYLLPIPFTIVTDCQAFAMTMKRKDLCLRVARWALLWGDFKYEVCHRPGKSMQHVDALSRNPLPSVMCVSESEDGLIARLRNAQNKDSEVLPKAMQTQVVKQAHERGHFGVTKTEAFVKQDFWFKGLREKVEHVIANCLDCILAERKMGKQEGYLKPLDKGDTPLDTYHIDHVGPMTVTKKRYVHIFVVVDAFTKFTWLYPTKSTDTVEVLDRLTKQAAVFGNPKRIISDRGTAFTSNAFRDYSSLTKSTFIYLIHAIYLTIEEGVEHSLITTGVPRGNGQVERVNRTLIPLLTKLTAPNPDDWYKHVEKVQRFLNSTVNRSTGKTPFQLLVGVDMRIKEDMQVRELIEAEWTAQFDENRCVLREGAAKAITEAQEKNKRNYNKGRKDARQYESGDLVAIKRTQFGAGLKLKCKFLGPYRVIRALRNDRYTVQKVGEHEGPNQTSTTADSMKLWGANVEDDDSGSSEAE
nr:uncharacterized protein LOC124223711 [Neodiprion pinetum]